MVNRNYNIGLICDFTVNNFWRRIDRRRLSVNEAKQMYEDFLYNNFNSVNESVENYFSDRQMLLEGLRDRYEKNQNSSGSAMENGIDDGDIEATKNVASSGVGAGNHRIVVQNVGKTPKDAASQRGVKDISFYTDCFYQGLINGDYEGIFTNEDEMLPPSLYDTSTVSDFTAVMAFKDLPNIDLSGWDVSSGRRFDGCFYKSSFNNASIKNWYFSKVISAKNMFVGSDMAHDEVISAWEAAYIRGDLPVLPSLGKMSADDSEEIMQDTRNELSGFKTQIDAMKRIKKNKMMYDENKTHRVMSSSEFINENFGDSMRKFGRSIKNAATNFFVKLRNGFTYFFDRAGLFFKANMPSNTVNFIKDGNVRGVYAEQGKAISYEGHGSGYYDEIRKGSREYDNYLKFIEIIGSLGAKNEAMEVDEIGMPIDEAKVGLYAKERDANGTIHQNIGAMDITTQDLERTIRRNIREVQKNGRSRSKPMIIWGAPGIGKTSIPKALVKATNEEIVKSGKGANEKMTVIVIDCSTLMAGDLSMPMPVSKTKVSEIMQLNPDLADKLNEIGITADDVDLLSLSKSNDAPKTWLPVYKPIGGGKNKLLDAIANGATTPIYDENDEVIDYEYSGGGGILMFDEFLRADPDTLFGIAQLMMNREFLAGYRLGSKWIVMGCSNRPTDDTQIQTAWQNVSPALKQRLGGFNFVPTYEDWVKWAKEKGGFDDITLDFIGGKDPYGEQSRWHNIDPTQSTGKNEQRTVSPRQWSQAISELNRLCEDDGVSDYLELGRDFEMTVKEFLPDDISNEYIAYYKASGGSKFKYSWTNIINDPNMKVEKGTTAKIVTNRLITYVKTHFSDTHIPQASQLGTIIDFLDRNFPTSGNLIAEFIVKTYKFCELDGKNFNDDYEAVYNKYNNAHPNLKLDELFDTIGEI